MKKMNYLILIIDTSNTLARSYDGIFVTKAETGKYSSSLLCMLVLLDA